MECVCVCVCECEDVECCRVEKKEYKKSNRWHNACGCWVTLSVREQTHALRLLSCTGTGVPMVEATHTLYCYLKQRVRAVTLIKTSRHVVQVDPAKSPD